ncbi:hypothetical protein GS8_634 [Geobacillus stearothermophilus]|uniref:Uncharacterized protein n=1 Tax=Geobacillus stearothermophilus TaxID=1422 RepID=A0A150NBK4_GEOSE|nr:hypothetical protein GS8_634 [Geobacillus stearothermophilus]KYD34059.1 hypothetical protein B4114_1162 [Geobacillus stearothermophilus]
MKIATLGSMMFTETIRGRRFALHPGMKMTPFSWKRNG